MNEDLYRVLARTLLDKMAEQSREEQEATLVGALRTVVEGTARVTEVWSAIAGGE